MSFLIVFVIAAVLIGISYIWRKRAMAAYLAATLNTAEVSAHAVPATERRSAGDRRHAERRSGQDRRHAA